MPREKGTGDIMKRTFSAMVFGLVLLNGFAVTPQLYAVEPSQVAADQLTMVKYYEGKAADQDRLSLSINR